ncbi:hypothetical protein MMC30_005478 [Trapelia coarctata]|nr:hypothetical protein [Trapelia coarctata]
MDSFIPGHYINSILPGTLNLSGQLSYGFRSSPNGSAAPTSALNGYAGHPVTDTWYGTTSAGWPFDGNSIDNTSAAPNGQGYDANLNTAYQHGYYYNDASAANPAVEAASYANQTWQDPAFDDIFPEIAYTGGTVNPFSPLETFTPLINPNPPPPEGSPAVPFPSGGLLPSTITTSSLTHPAPNLHHPAALNPNHSTHTFTPPLPHATLTSNPTVHTGTRPTPASNTRPRPENSSPIPNTRAPRPRVPCKHPTCTQTFSRSSDRDRHLLKHSAEGVCGGVRGFFCREPGCKYNGKPFYRRDKLLSHHRNVHS